MPLPLGMKTAADNRCIDIVALSMALYMDLGSVTCTNLSLICYIYQPQVLNEIKDISSKIIIS